MLDRLPKLKILETFKCHFCRSEFQNFPTFGICANFRILESDPEFPKLTKVNPLKWEQFRLIWNHDIIARRSLYLRLSNSTKTYALMTMNLSSSSVRIMNKSFVFITELLRNIISKAFTETRVFRINIHRIISGCMKWFL